ncbi:MAG TPA: hypothetical protein PKD68_02925 [Candidatus Saccharibacteria bacterium]|nr:hypothetical protein [Candidatus Saccharibacteria bacterium]
MTDDDSKAILAELEAIANSPGFIYTLSRVTRSDMFYAASEAADVDWRSRILQNELDLLTGYMIKNSLVLDTKPSQKEADETIAKIKTLLENLHAVQSKKFIQDLPTSLEELQAMKEEDGESLTKKIFGMGKNMVEPMFYGDSGAYDFQYLNLAPLLYSQDKEWLTDSGYDLDLYVLYTFALKHLIILKASNPNNNLYDADKILEVFSFDASELSKFAKKAIKDSRITDDSAQKFIDTFKSVPGHVNKDFVIPSDRNSLNAFPIIELPNERYYLNSTFNLSESIYNLPWIWMLQDKKYRTAAERNRGLNVETLAHGLLKRSFGDNIYHSVKVKKGSTILTDIDGLAIIGNKAIIFQEKSKWLTDLSKSGDETSLHNDFQKAIQDAYDQGIVSRQAILNQEGIVFELADGTVINPGETIDEAYIICVTASVYPAQMVQSMQYLKRQDDDPVPIATSLLDIDIITYYLQDPYDFLYYIQQRVLLHDNIHAESEIALLGYHLKYRLYIDPNEADKMYLDSSYGQLIDADIMHRAGYADEPKEKDKLRMRLDNELYHKIVSELKTIDDPRITDVILFLAGLSEDTIDEFMRLVQRAVESVLSGRKEQNDFSASIDNDYGGFTFVVAKDEDRMASIMNVLASKNKYLHKQDRWIALGANTNGGRLISGVQYLDGKWEQNDEMDRVLELAERRKRSQSRPATQKPKHTKKRVKRKKRPSKRKKK